MRSIVAITAFLVSTGVSAMAAEHRVVDPSGKVIGIILECNSCKDPATGVDCTAGVQAGYHDGKPCGQCLITANFGTKILYPFDLQISGTLQQPDGQPLADEFVRLFLANTWTVRTRTVESGFFRLVLGATEDRKGEMLKVDVGTKSRPKADGAADFAFYMLPENYKPCPE